MKTIVVAPCRLHFGLVHVPSSSNEGSPHLPLFGGLGVALATHQVRVEVSPAPAWSARGPLGERALRFAQTVVAQRANLPTAFDIHADGPLEHVGYGVGTALGLCVARAITAHSTTDTPLSVEQLARLVQRGQRSGVGLFAFQHGGVIVDAGKSSADSLPNLGGVYPLLPDWRIVLFRLNETGGWHGTRERTAFARPRDQANTFKRVHALKALIENTIQPALLKQNFAEFSRALGEFNHLAGEPFATDQGGSYASLAMAALIHDVKTWGFAGVGQSSWGPTMFAFTASQLDAELLIQKLNHSGRVFSELSISTAATHGVSITTVE